MYSLDNCANNITLAKLHAVHMNFRMAQWLMRFTLHLKSETPSLVKQTIYT